MRTVFGYVPEDRVHVFPIGSGRVEMAVDRIGFSRANFSRSRRRSEATCQLGAGKRI
jgi:hypothetical protein